ncbi:hypothetical protein M5689_003334 [Euphorbia peplus]|nr:hypothetical protein M5689_003334 [Euphorbia peplus]
MPTLSVSYEAILRYSLTQLSCRPPRFQAETAELSVYACRVFYTYRDNQGNEHPYNICGQSSISQADSKKSSCYAALLDLQRLHGLIIVDCNLLHFHNVKTEYLASVAAYKDSVVIPYSKLSIAYNDLKKRIEGGAELMSTLKPIVDRITRLF